MKRKTNMTYRTISVFEKPDVIVEDELWAAPGWAQLVGCFLYDGNPYISKVEKFTNEDHSYLEYHLDFHDEEAYHAWYEEWASAHDTLRSPIFETLRSRGVHIQLYWEGVYLDATNNESVLPITEFVSKIPKDV